MTENISRKFYLGKKILKGYLASVYNYRPRNENILQRKGEVFAVLRLKTDPDFDLITAGGILLDYFHETYFEIQETSTLLALEKTVISSSRHLAKLIDNDNKVGKSGIEMDLLAAAIVGNVAYFVNVGTSGLHILRDGEIVDLIPALKDPTGEGLVEVASMELQENDRLLMCTEAVDKLLKDDQIEKILDKFDLDEFPQNHKDDQEHALMIISYEKTIPAMKEIEPVEPDEQLIAVQEEETPLAEEKYEAENEQEMNLDQATAVEVEEEAPLDKKSQLTYKVVLAKLAARLKAIPSKVKSSISNRKTGQRVIPGGKTNTSRNAIVVVVVLIVLAGGLYLGVRQAISKNREKIETEETRVSLDALKQKVTLIEEMVEELKLADSTEKRQTGLNEVAAAKAEIEKVKDSPQVENEVKDYSERVEKAQNFFNRVVPVTEDNKLVDVASFFPDAKISDIAFSASKIYLTDSALGKIYSVGYDGEGLQEEVTGLKNPLAITVDAQGKLIFLDDSEDNRLAVYDPGTKATKRLAGTSTSRIGEVSDIEYAEIAGGRVYLINKTNKRVMYLEKSGENYGLPASRFELNELATGKDIYIIDNKIYVLAEINQGLYRFFNGQDDSPELIGLPEGEDMLKAAGLFADGTSIYFTDPTNKRIAVFEKGVQTAKFKGQFKATNSDILGSVKDIVAVSAQGKAYTIDNSIVYELDLTALNEL